MQLLKEGKTFVVRESDLIAHGDPDATYTVRPITLAVKERVERDLRKVGRSQDNHAVQRALLDYCLTDWSGVTDGGEPAACIEENKVQLSLDVVIALLGAAGLGEVRSAQAVNAQSFRPPA